MNLRARLLLLFLPLFAASLAGVWMLSDMILLDRFDRGDRQRLADEVRIVYKRISFEKQRYLDIVRSYAWWDASFAFVHTPQPKFIQENLEVDMLGFLGFDYVIYVDRQGRIVGQQWKLDNLPERFPGVATPRAEDLQRSVLKTAIDLGVLAIDGDTQHSVNQMLQIDGIPQLLLSYPISDTKGHAEPAGVLIAGVLFDKQRMAGLENQMGARLRLANDATQDSSWRPLNIPSNRGATLLSPRQLLGKNKQQMSLLYLNSQGQPQVRIEVISPRPLYQQGRQSIRLFLYLALALLLAALLLAYLALELWIIRRVRLLNREVSNIGQDESQQRLGNLGNDELGHLAGEMNHMLERLEQSEARDRAILDTIRDGYFEMDAGGHLSTVNPALCRMLGYPAEELIGRHFSTLLLDEDAQRARSLYEKAREDERRSTFSAAFKCRDGRLLNFETRSSIIRDTHGTFAGFRGILRDISDHVAYQNQLLDLAFRDAVTGLGNRKAFDEQLPSSITRCERIALLYIDLDKFKQVNDRYGHATGDDLLSAVGERLRNSLRQPDQAFRLGGDEFAVLLENAEAQQAERLGMRLLQLLGSPYELNGQTIDFVTPSIGIALYPQDAEDAESLTRAADIAMYQAKQERNRCQRYHHA